MKVLSLILLFIFSAHSHASSPLCSEISFEGIYKEQSYPEDEPFLIIKKEASSSQTVDGVGEVDFEFGFELNMGFYGNSGKASLHQADEHCLIVLVTKEGANLQNYLILFADPAGHLLVKSLNGLFDRMVLLKQ